jgi:hypothetical protein
MTPFPDLPIREAVVIAGHSSIVRYGAHHLITRHLTEKHHLKDTMPLKHAK